MSYEIEPDSGRYWVRDLATGRKFCVEPIRERNQKADDRVFTNGGITGTDVKHKSQVRGGSVPESDSIITPENGFQRIVYGSNPMDIIQQLLEERKVEVAGGSSLTFCEFCGEDPCECADNL